MQNNSFDSPIWGPGTFPSVRKSYIEFSIQPSLELGEDRTIFILEEAEVHLSSGRPQETIRLTEPLSKNDIARRLLLEALLVIRDPKKLVEIFWPPYGPLETLYVLDALWELGDRTRLLELLSTPSVKDSKDPAVVELRQKYSKRLGL